MKVIFYYLTAILIWGSTWYAMEHQHGVTPVEWSVTIRAFLTAFILFIICKSMNLKLTFSRKEHVAIMAFGILMFTINYVFVYQGGKYITSGLLAVTFANLTLMNMIMSRIFFKIPITPNMIFSGLLGVIGLGLIFLPEFNAINFDTGPIYQSPIMYGLFFGVLALTASSFGSVITATKAISALPTLSILAWGNLYGGICTGLIALNMGLDFTLDTRPEYWTSLGFLIIFGSVVAFSSYLWLLKNIGMTKTAYMFVITPLVALAISTVFEGYEWTTPSLTGLGLVLIGNILMLKKKTAPKSEREMATLKA